MFSIEDVFIWLGEAASGGINVLGQLATGVGELIVSPASEGGSPTLTTMGALILAGVGAPLAWKFIKYIISLFKQVKVN